MIKEKINNNDEILFKPFNFEEHFDLYSKWLMSEEIMYAFDYRPKSIDDLKTWVKEDKIFMIIVNNNVAGYINLYSINDEKKEAEIGYLLDNNYRGKGYMNYAMKFIINKAKQLNLVKIKAYTITDNTKSQELLIRFGFKFTEKRIEKNWPHYNGEIEWNWYELDL